MNLAGLLLVYFYIKVEKPKPDDTLKLKEERKVTFIPGDILVEILRRLGHNGFRELAPFICGNTTTNNAALQQRVLHEVEIDEFIFVSSLSNEDSLYRPFFVCCFNAGNKTAMYLEGLRRAVKNGAYNDGLALMKSAAHDLVYAKFAYEVFSICSGYYKPGMRALQDLYQKFEWVNEILEVGEIVMSSIADIEPQDQGKYIATYTYPTQDIPLCVAYNSCDRYDPCIECIAYWYSLRVREVC